MNRSLKRAARVASLLSLALMLSSCGGGYSSTSASGGDTVDLGDNGGSGSGGDTLGPGTLAVQGHVLNVGYVSNALVCADMDDDDLCGPDDPTTVTDAQGHYALTVPTGARGVHLLAQLRADSVDTAYPVNGAGDPSIAQGWTLDAPLEYPMGATSAQANISVLTSTYLMRLANQGHYRIINRLAVLVRSGQTGDLGVPIDFDYFATPPAGLAPSLQRLCDYLSARAATAGMPAPLTDTWGVLSAWYATYNAQTRPIMDVAGFDARTPGVIAAAIDGLTYRNYMTHSSLAADMRNYMVDKGGYVRVDDTVQTLISQGYILAGGQYDRVFQNWIADEWSDVSYPDPEFLTLTRAGALAYLSPTDPLQPRNILASDGNTIVYDTAVSGVRYQMELLDDVFHGFHLYDWGKNQNQLTTANYAYTQVPPTQPPCASDYNTGVAITSQNPDDWFTACITYYLYQHIGGLAGYHTVEDPQARSLFYDETLLDPLVKFPLAHPLISDCAAAGRATVQVLGHTTCNTMTADARTDHVEGELFDPAGIVVESWTTADAAFAPAVVPVQLRLVLQADGTGTISGPWAGVQLVENVQWTHDPANAAVVLVTWTPPDAGLPAPQLVAHFGNADFSLTPSVPASPRFNHLAIVLQDGVFVSGESYDAGYTNNFTADVYKRQTRRALEICAGMMNEIVGKLYREAGFR